MNEYIKIVAALDLEISWSKCVCIFPVFKVTRLFQVNVFFILDVNKTLASQQWNNYHQ